MLGKLFRREKPPVTEATKTYTEKEVSAVYDALVRGLDRIESQCVDRAVLTLYEFVPNITQMKWLSDHKDPTPYRYYPFGFLTPEEQDMIRNKKSYKVFSLVRDNVGGGFADYSARGVELQTRTRINPNLCRLKDTSNLHYMTEGGAYTGENIRSVAEFFTENGCTPDAVNERVEAGIQQYHQKTIELMEEAGVYAALEEMETRWAPFEEIMTDMRENIEKAKDTK